MLLAAREAQRGLARLSGADRDQAIRAVADSLHRRQAEILAANAEDVAKGTALSPALLDRLRLSPARLSALEAAVRAVAAQPDPLAAEEAPGTIAGGMGPPSGALSWTGPTGIVISERRVPLGVIAIVYEARPNVAAECAALTLKSGNALVLRGGKEAQASSRAIVQAIAAGLSEVGVDQGVVQLVTDPAREAVVELLRATGLVDLVIPRGGAGLMALVDAEARVPVIRHGQGICHVYVHAQADLTMALEITDNAKTQRPGVCNALETLLVDAAIAEPFLAALGPRLAAKGVELRGCQRSRPILEQARVACVPARPEDYDTEFLALILAVRVVDGLPEALEHIARHGSHHSASIVTRDGAAAERFLSEVDASCVLHNASTRLNDGGELGLGAEMGISTSKLHAYGPMGAKELTQKKRVVRGSGQIRP